MALCLQLFGIGLPLTISMGGADGLLVQAARRSFLIRDGWCRVGLAPLTSHQSRENREHVRHVHEEFVITGRRDKLWTSANTA